MTEIEVVFFFTLIIYFLLLFQASFIYLRSAMYVRLPGQTHGCFCRSSPPSFFRIRHFQFNRVGGGAKLSEASLSARTLII